MSADHFPGGAGLHFLSELRQIHVGLIEPEQPFHLSDVCHRLISLYRTLPSHDSHAQVVASRLCCFSALTYCLGYDLLEPVELPLLRFAALSYGLPSRTRHLLSERVLSPAQFTRLQYVHALLEQQHSGVLTAGQSLDEFFTQVEPFARPLLTVHGALLDPAFPQAINARIGVMYGSFQYPEDFRFEGTSVASICGASRMLDSAFQHVQARFSACPECVISSGITQIALLPVSQLASLPSQIETSILAETLTLPYIITAAPFSLTEVWHKAEPHSTRIPGGFSYVITHLERLRHRPDAWDRPVPHFELFPYVQRCEVCNLRPSLVSYRHQHLCEVCARQQAYLDYPAKWQPTLNWHPPFTPSWQTEFVTFLQTHSAAQKQYVGDVPLDSLRFLATPAELGTSLVGFVRAKIQVDLPAESLVAIPCGAAQVQSAVQEAVFQSIVRYLHPVGEVHPFEVLVLNQDEILLMLPAVHALSITHAFTEHLEAAFQYEVENPVSMPVQRYLPARCDHRTLPAVTLNAGVLFTSLKTPPPIIRHQLDQLTYSAANYQATLYRKGGYCLSVIDFRVFRSPGTPLTHQLTHWRDIERTVHPETDTCTYHLTGAPYTVAELEGLLHALRGFQQIGCSAPEIYQLQASLKQGFLPAILAYLTWRTAKSAEQPLLPAVWGDAFEHQWDFLTPPWLNSDDEHYYTPLADVMELLSLEDHRAVAVYG
ncbi:MAG: hypothetical protein D6675_06270 [Gemmatimonadetes bacterium]|nr:MAG: hypothetical protein D6675_06270 [Gemmatimonadota bacterium]